MLEQRLLDVAPDVGQEQVGDTIYVARLPFGPLVVLEGVGALIWREARGRDTVGIVCRVAERTGTDSTTIAAAVESFIDDLVARRLLGFV